MNSLLVDPSFISFALEQCDLEAKSGHGNLGGRSLRIGKDG